VTGFEEFGGLVARRGDLRFARVVETMPLPQGFDFIRMTEEVDLCVGRAIADIDMNPDDEIRFLAATVLRCLGAEQRAGSTVAHILAHPLGQYTYAFRDGDVVQRRSLDYVAADGVTPEDMPINATLRDLGVERGDAPDEAAALGLRLPGPGQTDRSSSAR
jgi:hypothetical protein